MNNPSKQTGNSTMTGLFAAGAIIFAFVCAVLIYKFIMGNAANFQDRDVLRGHPTNILGIIHRGGFIVPMLVGINIIVIIFFIERLITLGQASGRGNATVFIRKVRELLANHKIDEAIAACDKQKGSLANVVRSGLGRYKMAAHDKVLTKDEKVAA
ncbi:MAG: MotA/TolQ/ExbB proton channel family protein, partial [Bacteroidia bacterium]|nr:MotA/TolQ/ExbB proton channel family protein [Bacteroidia bacterium]